MATISNVAVIIHAEVITGRVFSFPWSRHQRMTPAGSNGNSSIEHGMWDNSAVSKAAVPWSVSTSPILANPDGPSSLLQLSSWEAGSALTIKNPVPFTNSSPKGRLQPGCWNTVMPAQRVLSDRTQAGFTPECVPSAVTRPFRKKCSKGGLAEWCYWALSPGEPHRAGGT